MTVDSLRDHYRTLAVQWDEARDEPPQANRLFDALHALNKEMARKQPTSIRLDASSTRPLAQTVIWSTGEMDLIIGDARSGDVLLDEHREITGEVGIADAIRTIKAYLAERPSTQATDRWLGARRAISGPGGWA